MVEIALAMAIIAIGLSSILVLFPVGVNANKSAIADNNLADIAEYVMSHLRAGCSSEWYLHQQNASADKFFTQHMKTSLVDINNDTDAKVANNSLNLSDWTSLNSSSSTGATRLLRLNKPNVNGIFLFQQLTRLPDGTDIADFSTIIKVWLDQDFDLFYPDPYATTMYQELTAADASRLNLGDYAKAFCIELSWPAEVTYENREKRIFRFELFNESYEAK